MAPTCIYECPNCNGLMLATEKQKTRTCPYCSKRIKLNKAKCLASAKDAFQASFMLKKIKTQKQSNLS
ncbi:MAG: DUF1922 domain-containing protein [Candidatus Bathyarchaeota archaeon]|nr:DUF1922 domain-containing protein [Candidatus Bathyarchaeota archaeon]